MAVVLVVDDEFGLAKLLADVPLDSTVVEEARLHGLAKRIREE